MINKKRLTALGLVACLALAGCGAKSGSSSGTTINVSIASEPETIDPAKNASVDGGTMIIHAFSGLAGYDEQGNIVADSAKELVEGVTNEDGTVTYTYTLRDGLKWSDGEEVKASDFAYAWNRAINPETGADYEYMFSIIQGYDEGKLNVVADDAAKTLTVTIKNHNNYWEQLLVFPTYFPVREDIVTTHGDAWATDPSTYVTNGAYKLTSWTHDSKLVFEKNENYWNKDNIKMDKVTFYLSDDSSNMLANFKNKTYALIDDVPTDEISNLKTSSDEFYINGQLGTYYAFINESLDLLPDFSGSVDEKEMAQMEVRKAISLLLDRNYIVESVAQGGQEPASTFVGKGISDSDGSEYIENVGVGDFYGYWNTSNDAYQSNIDTALATLKNYYTFDDATGKFTDIPTLTYSYNTNDGHQAIAEYIQYCFEQYGITVTLENMEWAVYQTGVQEGSVTMGRYGWLADYDDPMTFLDMWTDNNGNNSAHIGSTDVNVYSIDLTEFGYEVYTGSWADTYDKVIEIAKATTDMDTYYKLCHKAEDLLMSTGCVVPLYYYTDVFMASNDYTGIVYSKLGFKLFHYSTQVEAK